MVNSFETFANVFYTRHFRAPWRTIQLRLLKSDRDAVRRGQHKQTDADGPAHNLQTAPAVHFVKHLPQVRMGTEALEVNVPIDQRFAINLAWLIPWRLNTLAKAFFPGVS